MSGWLLLVSSPLLLSVEQEVKSWIFDDEMKLELAIKNRWEEGIRQQSLSTVVSASVYAPKGWLMVCETPSPLQLAATY